MALNVLVVDDSAVMRAMIVKTLRLTGIELGEIIEAGNGQEALDLLDKSWIDIVLADINMPVMNGEEMIERMRAKPETRDVPVIVVSSEGSRTRIERLEQKCSAFIHKPFEPETVRSVLKQITGVTDEQGT